MRHGKKGYKLGRTHAHREATLAALSNALIKHKSIRTTLTKAKALRGYVEPLITRSKANTTHNRRLVFSHLQDKAAVTELFGDIAERIGDRRGGYTRVVKLGQRSGDGAEMAVIELVDYNETGPETGGTRRRRTRRGGRGRRRGEAAATTTAAEAPVEEAVEEAVDTVEEIAAADTADDLVEEVADEAAEAEVAAEAEPAVEAEAEVEAPADEADAEVAEVPAEAPAAEADAPAEDEAPEAPEASAEEAGEDEKDKEE